MPEFESPQVRGSFYPSRRQIMKNLMNNVKRLVRDEDGVTAIEYGLIAALIAVVIIAAVRTVGLDLQTIFGTVSTGLKNAS